MMMVQRKGSVFASINTQLLHFSFVSVDASQMELPYNGVHHLCCKHFPSILQPFHIKSHCITMYVPFFFCSHWISCNTSGYFCTEALSKHRLCTMLNRKRLYLILQMDFSQSFYCYFFSFGFYCSCTTQSLRYANINKMSLFVVDTVAFETNKCTLHAIHLCANKIFKTIFKLKKTREREILLSWKSSLHFDLHWLTTCYLLNSDVLFIFFGFCFIANINWRRMVRCEQVCQFDVHYLIMQNSEFITGNTEYYFLCCVNGILNRCQTISSGFWMDFEVCYWRMNTQSSHFFLVHRSSSTIYGGIQRM